MDVVDEGVSRPFKPWDMESSDYPPNPKRLIRNPMRSDCRRLDEFQETTSVSDD
jgi:hypothetical protein